MADNEFRTVPPRCFRVWPVSSLAGWEQVKEGGWNGGDDDDDDGDNGGKDDRKRHIKQASGSAVHSLQ